MTFGAYGVTHSVTGTLIVNGTLTFGGLGESMLISGTVLASGDVTVSKGARGGTGLVKLIGSGNQTVTGTSGQYMPKLEIASTGGTVTFSGTVGVGNNFTYTSGTLDLTGSTIDLSGANWATLTFTPGPITYNNLILSGYQVTRNITAGTTVNGNVTLAGIGGCALTMSGQSFTVGGTLTVNSGTSITKSGGTLTYGTLSNSGTINP